jgi:hypothetical protein
MLRNIGKIAFGKFKYLYSSLPLVGGGIRGKNFGQMLDDQLLLPLLGGRGGFLFAHAALFPACGAFLGFAAGVDGGAAFFTGKYRHD